MQKQASGAEDNLHAGLLEKEEQGKRELGEMANKERELEDGYQERLRQVCGLRCPKAHRTHIALDLSSSFSHRKKRTTTVSLRLAAKQHSVP